jgi:hypothetical protein
VTSSTKPFPKITPSTRIYTQPFAGCTVAREHGRTDDMQLLLAGREAFSNT